MAEISSTNTVRVTLSATPKGLSEKNIASIVIFSNEKPNKSGEYFAPMSPSEVANIFGSDSRTFAMANSVLGQTPNIRTARGSLYVVPYIAQDAKRGNFVTTNIKANISAFKEVTNGSLKITVNGKPKSVSGLNFSACSTASDIADVINNAGLDVEVFATSTTDSDTITIASKLVGATSSVQIQTADDGVDIGGLTYLNATAGVSTNGQDSTATETLAEAIARIDGKLSFGGILTTQDLENTAIINTAKVVQALDHVFFVSTNSLDNIETLGKEIKEATLTKTRVVAYGESFDGAKEFVAGYASIALSPNFKASNTANTMNLKSIAGVTGDDCLTQEYFNSAKKYGVDVYGNTGGLSCVYSFDNGKYTDEVVGDLWLKTQFEVAVFNVLRQTNTKIAQTETGMTVLKMAVDKVCAMGVNNGLIGVGLKWNGADRFGDPEDFDRNITEHGYYIYSLPIAEQDQAEREARIAPVIQTAIKRAGAIHEADLIVILER